MNIKTYLILFIRERSGQQFWMGPELQPGPGLGFMQCFILCLEYIARQATRVLTPHVNAVNGVNVMLL